MKIVDGADYWHWEMVEVFSDPIAAEEWFDRQTDATRIFKFGRLVYAK